MHTMFIKKSCISKNGCHWVGELKAKASMVTNVRNFEGTVILAIKVTYGSSKVMFSRSSREWLLNFFYTPRSCQSKATGLGHRVWLCQVFGGYQTHPWLCFRHEAFANARYSKCRGLEKGSTGTSRPIKDRQPVTSFAMSRESPRRVRGDGKVGSSFGEGAMRRA